MAFAEALDAPGEDFRWRARIVQRALPGRLLEQDGGAVARALGVREHGRECVPGGLVEDLFGVGGHGRAQVLGVSVRDVGGGFRTTSRASGAGAACP
ncbi:hypothetical protein ACFZC6_42620 [Streptomyces ossamyceticus]|uniref:hypothetical protein n=1 Tax=Streptomyces TaxID=1883 RepID=UPI001B3122B7|nr:hypothetical protein [Streptomyces europaeiscabiei]MDX3841257.1 hypothetical protein [Streptomyces europaeiscabiei]